MKEINIEIDAQLSEARRLLEYAVLNLQAGCRYMDEQEVRYWTQAVTVCDQAICVLERLQATMYTNSLIERLKAAACRPRAGKN